MYKLIIITCKCKVTGDIASFRTPLQSPFRRIAINIAGHYIILRIRYENFFRLRIYRYPVRNQNIPVCAVCDYLVRYLFHRAGIQNSISFFIFLTPFIQLLSLNMQQQVLHVQYGMQHLKKVGPYGCPFQEMLPELLF